MKSFQQFVVEDNASQPVHIAPLTLHQFPLLAKASAEKRNRTVEALTKFIAIANQAIADGIISRKDINRLIDLYKTITVKAGEFLKSKHSSRLPGEETKENWHQHHEYGILYRDATEMHYPQHLGMKLDYVNAKVPLDHPLKTEYLELTKEYRILADIIPALEGYDEKKVLKARERAAAIAAIPHATRNAQELVRRVLMKMTEQVKDEYRSFYETSWKTQIQEFFAMENEDRLRHLKMHPEDDAARKARYREAKAKVGAFGVREEKRTPHYIESLLQEVADMNRYSTETGHEHGHPLHGKPIWTLKKNWQDLLHHKAERQANDMQLGFVEKNVMKLAAIVETKGNIDGDPKVLNVHCQQGVIEGNIRFEFRDSSKFVVRNKVVSKWYESSGGGYATMYQFPTTFHDAVLPNGKKMPGQPSEVQMNQEFATARA